jgi:uncharacterized protein
MSDAGKGGGIDAEDLAPPKHRAILRRSLRIFLAAAALMLNSAGDSAKAQSSEQDVSAFNRRDYQQTSQIFIPLPERGNVSVQAYLGFMFETGRGVPQNYKAREARARIRDAVNTKMTRGEIARACLRALELAPTIERS